MDKCEFISFLASGVNINIYISKSKHVRESVAADDIVMSSGENASVDVKLVVPSLNPSSSLWNKSSRYDELH